MSKYLSVTDISEAIVREINATIDRHDQTEIAHVVDTTQPTISTRYRTKRPELWDLKELIKLACKCPVFRSSFARLINTGEIERVVPPENFSMSSIKIAGDLISEIAISSVDNVFDGDELTKLIIKSAEVIEHMTQFRNALLHKRNANQEEIELGQIA